jgi:GAF domain-containing protein
MDSAAMMDRSDRRDIRLNTLRAVSRGLARPLSAADVLRIVHRELGGALDVPICFFGLYDALGDTIEVIWQIHDGVELPGGHFPLGSGPTSQVVRTGNPRLIRQWSRELPPVQVQYATERPDLPESAITVAVVFDQQVLGVLSIQSYQSQAFDEDDVTLVQSVADQAAVALAAAMRGSDAAAESLGRASDLEVILASMSDAVLVLDDQGRLIRLNQAARTLLCLANASLILGHPVDRPHAGHWPLGTPAVTRQLQPVIDQLKRGAAPPREVEVKLDAGHAAHSMACRASLLLKQGLPAGGLMVLRPV